MFAKTLNHGSEILQLSPGEIHFLWWFIQGSIMNPSTRTRLRRAWGMCQRHSWGWMVVEAAFRNAYMHGPAVLYEDLMVSAARLFKVRGPGQLGRIARRLREKHPCLMCEEGYNSASKGFVKPHIVKQGRDLTQFRLLAARTQAFWGNRVCGSCTNTDSPLRCRIHLIAELSSGHASDIAFHRDALVNIVERIRRYARSFQFEFQGTRTYEDEAALIEAVAWCCGWETFFALLSISEEESANPVRTSYLIDPEQPISKPAKFWI